jgi:hypothetical protein
LFCAFVIWVGVYISALCPHVAPISGLDTFIPNKEPPEMRFLSYFFIF